MWHIIKLSTQVEALLLLGREPLNWLPLGLQYTLYRWFLSKQAGFEFLVTNVYGPSVDEEKARFIDELGTLANIIKHPWILAGDFNLVRWFIDRTGDLRGIQLMDLFNDFIRDVGLVDVQLKNRQYTWSNKRPRPKFSKLDRVFTSADWQLNYPVVQLEALGMVVSDHAPLILTCKSMATRPRQPKFEIFWLKYDTPATLVQQLWSTEEADPQISLHNFSTKTISLHKALSVWHRKDFSLMETQLLACKKATLFFDRIEEKRVLAMHEFKLRCRIKEKSFELANNLEHRWRQRARCRWLTQGDRNTRYFHAFASSRMRRNAVLALTHNEQCHADPRIIRELFLQQMQCTLGHSIQVKPFNAKALYAQNPSLGHLVAPVTDNEIEVAIRSLANNKASGPDGIPNEFVKGYWPFLKSEICNIVQGFFQGRVNLSEVNHANVIMLPKIDSPQSVGDYRPISVINIIPKIVSKIMANRLGNSMKDLISPYQTAFIRGRQISDNFVATREILQHISVSKREAVFMKLDFAKAFDSIEWEFLFEVMKGRGFPPVWIGWVKALLSTAHSRVVINGENTEFFVHKRGLRQGDPLSPLLFNIAVDVFQQMVGSLNKFLQRKLTRKVGEAILALQYADDTAVVASADITSLISLKLVMRIFSSISGLNINYKKSIFVPMNLTESHITWVKHVLGCSETQFPVLYLGMPLTVLKPTRDAYAPLLEKIEHRLGGWKSKMLSRGGRLELVRSVLSAIPIYHMTCFQLPLWVIERIDKVRRGFLWGKNGGAERGISLTNWETVCIPRNCGGLGVTNLKLVNIALLLRWWWKAYHEPESLWAIVIGRIRKKGTNDSGPKIWNITGSFFWSQLCRIKGIFTWSTTWIVGDGSSISYWYDNWNDHARAEGTVTAACMPRISLKDAQDVLQEINPNETMLMSMMDFTGGQDLIQWKWESTGVYSAKSIYKVLSEGGRIMSPFKQTWRCKIPPTVKLFAYLLTSGKLLTREALRRRGMRLQMHCVLCRNCPTESALHLLYLCPYSVEVWYHVSTTISMPLLTPAMTINQVWAKSWGTARRTGGVSYKQWMANFIGVAWMIWKQRNAIVFDGNRLPPRMLAARAAQEIHLWTRYC